MNINPSEYPLFCGRVVGIPAIIEQGNRLHTLVDYIAVKDELTEKEARSALMTSLFGLGKDQKEELEKRLKRATVPLRLDPSVVVGADVRTRFANFQASEECVQKTYEFEIIKGPPEATGDVFAALSSIQHGPRYTGMKYIKVVGE